MICKKDVIIWFKELESYKRIDTMCTLLSMCLPFELRFLGTCLEELGRRDSQELRGIELRVNNPQDLAIDMGACQKGEPTDMKIRRKMALYLALIRACNRTSTTSTEIFRTLDVWGDRDFQSMNDMDTLQELLLVYTMAANHPVFSFEQHRRCIEIFENIKKNKLVSDPEPLQTSTHSTQIATFPITQMESMSTSPIPTTGSTGQLQHEMRHQMGPPSHQELLQSHALHIMHLPGQPPQLLSCQPPIQVIPPMSLQHPMALDPIHYLSNTIPADSNAMLAHPNAPMSLRSYPPLPQGPTSLEHPPQSSSPMLSQQSSPSSSRTTSPSRATNINVMQQGIAQSQQMRNVPQRLGGPSIKTTPPPILPPSQKHVDDAVMSSDGTGNQLQTLIRHNGYTRAAHHQRIKSGNFIQQQQPTPVNPQFQTVPGGNYATGLNYAMQSISLNDGNTGSCGMMGMNSNKSTGSDSGSSIGSSGEISPPDTPANPSGHRMNSNDQQQPKQHHHQPTIFKQMTMGRLNGGRGDITLAPGGNAGSSNMIASNNNMGDVNNSGSNLPIASNNNMNTIGTTGLINTSTSSGTTGSSGVVTSNVLLQPQQQVSTQQQPQYNATYSYHTAQHITTTRPSPQLIPHNPAGSMAAPATFRFPIAPNGETIYPNTYHPTSLALHCIAPSGASATGAPPQPVILAASTASGVVANTTATTQLQQIQPQPGAMLAVSPYTALSLSATNPAALTAKPISCYNCGSQAHTGRDCQEASMDDAGRSAVYKLDYSVSAVTTPGTNVATMSQSIGSSGISGSSTDNTIVVKQQENVHASTSSTAVGTVTMASATVAAVSNVK